MEKINSLNQVAEFHKTFNAPVLETPQIPSEQRCKLRVSLLQEELNELSQAIKDGDLVEIADALCDLQYVLSGAVLEFGMGNKFDKIFENIHNSNMSKACESEREAEETLLFYKHKDGTEGYYKEINGKWLVYRSSDDKILKSINYSPVNIKGLLDV